MLKELLAGRTLYHAAGVRGQLDDYVHTIDALISAYEATAQDRYRAAADELMATCLETFFDHERGGFFDAEQAILGVRLKRIEDTPHPSPNAVAVMSLLKLSALTGKEAYRKAAEQTLRIFADISREIGVHAGAYFCALDAWLRPLSITIEAQPGSVPARAALSRTLRSDMVVYGEDHGRIIPCVGETCYEPLMDGGAVTKYFNKLHSSIKK